MANVMTAQSAGGDRESVAHITAFMRGFSLEAMKLADADVAGLAASLPAKSQVYLSATPSHPHPSLVAPAQMLRAAGFEPVPHLAARRFGSAAELRDVLARMTNEAGVRRVHIIGGDVDRATGPYTSALELIDSNELQRAGIEEIGIAGYPEGHPRISTDVLDLVLSDKIEAAEQTGLRVHIVTQFASAAEPVLRYIARLRRIGIEQPIRIGMAGPTNIAKLIGYARRCGVLASAQALTRQAGLLKHLVGTATPDTIVSALAQAAHDQRLGDVSVHLFSFGGATATARWACAVAAGRLRIEHGGNFRAEPPGR